MDSGCCQCYRMEVWVIWLFLMGTILPQQGLKAQDCGVAPLNTRIVGGEDATPGFWPWQVSVHYTNYHICGGTIINTQWVLTAAHCIISKTTSSYLLYFGKQTQSGSNPNEVNRTVSQIIVHPDYNNTLYNNDIALIKLSSTITYTNYIRPVCLASNSSHFYNSTLCWATGWGRLSKDKPNVAHDILQEVQIPVIANNQCTGKYNGVKNANITSNMLCAGELGKGICQGDSGGPLQCKQGSKWIQAGITSFGVPCAIGYPEVYARVSEYQSWITSQVAGTTVGFVQYNSTPQNSTTAAPNGAASSELSLVVMVFSAAFLAQIN